jgi:hypothetical protein
MGAGRHGIVQAISELRVDKPSVVTCPCFQNSQSRVPPWLCCILIRLFFSPCKSVINSSRIANVSCVEYLILLTPCRLGWVSLFPHQVTGAFHTGSPQPHPVSVTGNNSSVFRNILSSLLCTTSYEIDNTLSDTIASAIARPRPLSSLLSSSPICYCYC